MKVGILFFLFYICLSGVNGYDRDPFKHTRVLDKNGKYVLEWYANWQEKRIYFRVSVETRGWIGLGLSRKGLMNGADIVMGGVGKNGKPYFSDRHGVGHQPVVDDSQDWTLNSAWESKTHTFLSFSRPFETCDNKNDLSINEDNVIAVIWAYGETDNENEYHYQNKGALDIYLLDPDLTPRELVEQTYVNVTRPTPTIHLRDWKIWTIVVNAEIPVQDTTYQCSFHKPPRLQKKHHIVGVSADEMFGKFVGQPGQECYVFVDPSMKIPAPYCIEMRHEWSVGQGPVFMPEGVGVPFMENSNEYYMIQLHYDNPDLKPKIQTQVSLEIFYTDKLRQHDAGFLLVGELIATPTAPTSILIPPSERNHVIYGHCATGCTQKMIPEEGINIFAAKMHTHVTGIGTRLMNIHNKKEISITIDDNYNYNYQAYRTLREERKVLPGDMLYSRCIYSTTGRSKEATVGSFSTRDEMCHGFVYYYPMIRSSTYAFCSSEIRSDVYKNFLQIHNSTWSAERRQYVVNSPPQNAGLTFQEAATKIDWNLDRRTQLQTHHRFLPQISSCYDVGPESVTVGLNLLRDIQAGVRAAPEERAVDEETNLTDLNSEILFPGYEFVSLWPEGLSFYKRESVCPKRK